MIADEGNVLRFVYKPHGSKGTVSITVELPGGEPAYTDKLDVTRLRERERFLDSLCERHPGLDRLLARGELERIAAEVVVAPDEPDDPDKVAGGSEAETLVALGKRAELFHTPGGHDSEGYASIEVNGHRETWSLGSRAFERWLSREYYQQTESVPSQQGIKEALNVLAGIAIHDGPESVVAVRLAEHDGRFYLDLADEEWNVVEIGPDGWHLLTSIVSPVRFIRKRGMLPLPQPERGGRIDELRRFVNLPGDDGWVLYTACLVAYLRPRGPFPILVLNGEHGSAKSTTARHARALIDPNQAPLRRPPHGDRDLMIAATNSWFVVFDNISGLSAQMSDALCVLSTGGGFGARQLYSDDDEKIFQAQRPVLLNGIDEVATRADLLDRTVMLALPVIEQAQRRPEDAFLVEFEAARPRILGALLEAVACGLRRLPEVALAQYPRMADFARWAVACAPGMGWKPEQFLEVYTANRREGDYIAIESSEIGRLLVRLVGGGEWSGTATQLSEAVGELADDQVKRQRFWPGNGQKMRWALMRIAPNLRAIGYEVEFDERSTDKERKRLLRIRKVPDRSSGPSGSSGSTPAGAESAGPAGRSSGDPDRRSSEDRPRDPPAGVPQERGSDDPDEPDDPLGTLESTPDADWGEL